MIYLDTSVALAQLLAEDQRPPAALWEQPLISSRLLEYELWKRLHARDLAGSHGEAAELLLARISLIELSRDVLVRALDPFPVAVRTLDALHLGSLEFLRAQGLKARLASYDTRLGMGARAMGHELEPL